MHISILFIYIIMLSLLLHACLSTVLPLIASFHKMMFGVISPEVYFYDIDLTFTQNSWENVREEMLSKGLSPEVADRVYDFVGRYGKHKLLEELQKDPSLASVPAARQGLEELLLLLEYCKAYGVIDKVSTLNNYLVYICVHKNDIIIRTY